MISFTLQIQCHGKVKCNHKSGVSVQTKNDYPSRLHIPFCPPFPIFPGEKIMWQACVILPKLPTPDSSERPSVSSIFHISAGVFTESVWASVGVFVFFCFFLFQRPLTASIGGERSAPRCRRTSNLFRHGDGRLMRHTCYPCTVISRCRAAKRSNITREITGRQRKTHTDTDAARRKEQREKE